jgi:hypothetical protein
MMNTNHRRNDGDGKNKTNQNIIMVKPVQIRTDHKNVTVRSRMYDRREWRTTAKAIAVLATAAATKATTPLSMLISSIVPNHSSMQ